MIRKRVRSGTDSLAKTNFARSALFESFGYAALAGLFVLTTFLPGEQNERSGIVHLPAILWSATAGLGMIWTFWKRKTPPETKPGQKEWSDLKCTTTDLFVYSFFAWTIISILWNLWPGRGGAPRSSLNMLSVWILLLSAWFLLRQTVCNLKIVVILLGLMFAVQFSQAVLGIYQEFVEIPEIQRRFDQDPIKLVSQADPTIEPGSSNWERLANRLRTAAPSGTYPLSNSLGGLLACWLTLSTGFFLFQWIRRKTFAVSDGLFAVLLFLSFLCLIYTKCRSAYVALGLGFILLSLTLVRQKLLPSSRNVWKVFWGTGIASVVLIGIVLSTSSGKTVLSGAKKSLGFRLEYWQASLDMIRDYPIFGCGSGNFKQTYTKYRLPFSSEEIADPHCFAVEIAATSGLPALLCFCIPIGSILVFCYRNPITQTRLFVGENETSISLDACFGAGLFACWLAFFLSFLGEAPMSLAAPIIATFLFPLTAWLLKKILPDEQNETSVLPRLMGIALIVLFVHLLAAGGISVPSTALTLWVLAAGILVYRDNDGKHGPKTVKLPFEHKNTPDRHRICPKIFYFALLVFWGSSAVFVNQLSFRPIVASLSPEIRLESERNPLQRIALLQEAAEADPYSSSIRDRLAMECFGAWLATSDPNWEHKMMTAQNDALRLNPRSATLRFAVAERMNVAFQRTGESKHGNSALKYYAEAVERYPNNARFHAEWSQLLWRIGQKSEAIEQRDLALKLDDQMPHLDQKLSDEQRKALSEFDQNGL